MSIGELIKNYRTEHNLSQRKFAAQCGGITNGYIAMLEMGRNPSTGKPIIPSIDKLAAIANGMGMSLDQLFRSVDDMPVFVGDTEKWDAEAGKGTQESDGARRVSAGYDKMPPDMRKAFFAYLDMSVFAPYFKDAKED